MDPIDSIDEETRSGASARFVRDAVIAAVLFVTLPLLVSRLLDSIGVAQAYLFGAPIALALVLVVMRTRMNDW